MNAEINFMANQVITFCFLLNNLNYNIPNNDLNGNILTLLQIIQRKNNNTNFLKSYSESQEIKKEMLLDILP